MASVDKILYLYTPDPTRSIEAHFRRGYARVRSALTRSSEEVLLDGFPANLKQYAERDDDVFEVEEHVMGFMRQTRHAIGFWNLEQKTECVPCRARAPSARPHHWPAAETRADASPPPTRTRARLALPLPCDVVAAFGRLAC